MCQKRSGRGCQHGLRSVESRPSLARNRTACNRSRLDELPQGDCGSLDAAWDQHPPHSGLVPDAGGGARDPEPCQSLRDLERFAIRHHSVLTFAISSTRWTWRLSALPSATRQSPRSQAGLPEKALIACAAVDPSGFCRYNVHKSA